MQISEAGAVVATCDDVEVLPLPAADRWRSFGPSCWAALNPTVALEGVLLTMADERTNLSQQVSADVRSHFGDQVFKTTIPRSIRLAEAPSFGKPVLLYDIKSRASECFLSLAREILNRTEKGDRS